MGGWLEELRLRPLSPAGAGTWTELGKNKQRLMLCQAQFNLKVELRFVAKSVEVEIEAELVLKSFILFFCGRVGGCGWGGVRCGVWRS